MIFCFHFLIYILLKQLKHSNIIFLIIKENVFLLFFIKSTLILYDISITKLKISRLLDFAIMDYKIQEAIF